MHLGYIYLAPLAQWFQPRLWQYWGLAYLFTNRRGVIPGRWGFGFCGLLEVGSRQSGDPVGCWLKRHGLWPW